MMHSRLANIIRIETSALQENISSFFRDPRSDSSKDTRNAHGLFFIADHQIVFRKCSFFIVECDELGSCWQSFYDHFLACDFISIKSMEWLTKLMQNEIRDVNHVADRSQTDCLQLVFQPIRRFFYGNSGNCQSGI